MKKTKYNVDTAADRRTYQGIPFASILEMQFYRDVVPPLLSSGRVAAVEIQVPFLLQEAFTHEDKKIPAITYVADFVFRLPDGRMVVIDTKGCPDEAARLKRKLFWWHYPEIPFYWVGHSKIDGGWVPWEAIQKGRAQRRKEKKKREEHHE